MLIRVTVIVPGHGKALIRTMDSRGADVGVRDQVDSDGRAPRFAQRLPPGPANTRSSGVAAWRESAQDRLTHGLGHRHHPDASWALGPILEATAELPGLVAHLQYLDSAPFGLDAAAAQPEQLPGAQPGAGLGDEVIAVEGAAGSQEFAELLRGEGAPKERQAMTPL
jgi:hypothetical protein